MTETHFTRSGASPPAHAFAAALLVLALALNPAVSQDTISTTICVRGWSASVRPPFAVTAAVKRALHAQRGEILDHVVPLELGGHPTAPENLQLQSVADAHAKDVEENRLHRAVCRGAVTLDDAQTQMWNWRP